ncbi:MAG: YCF48-related protein [Pseudomonadota bacterium]
MSISEEAGVRRPLRLSPLSALLAAALVAMAPAKAQESVDFTHLPALENPTVAEALMLAVTRAGDRLVAVGERGLIAYSEDGGDSWTQATVPLSVNLTSVAFIDDQRGAAGGHEGMVLTTEDGGATWAERFDGVKATQQEIAFAEEKITSAQAALDALEEGADDMDASLAVEDAQWALEDLQTALDEGPSNPFLALWFDDGGKGVAAGAYGTLFATANGGEAWTLAARNIENPDKYHYYGIDQAGDGTLYLVGEAGLLYRSDDGGATWITLDSPYEGSYFSVLTGTDGDEAYVLAFGLRGNIYRSTDRGEQWQRIDVANQASLTAGTHLADGRVVLVGNSGAILVSADHGRTFSVSYREDRLSLSGVAAADPSHVVVVGAAGIHRVEIP